MPQEAPAEPTELPFQISHETLEYGRTRPYGGRRRRLRPFRVTGRLHDAVVSTTQPLTGEVVVEESECPVKVIQVFWGFFSVHGRPIRNPLPCKVIEEISRSMKVNQGPGEVWNCSPIGREYLALSKTCLNRSVIRWRSSEGVKE